MSYLDGPFGEVYLVPFHQGALPSWDGDNDDQVVRVFGDATN